MKRIIRTLAVSLAMIVGALGLSTASASAYQPAGNSAAGGAGYTAALQSCRWATQWVIAVNSQVPGINSRASLYMNNAYIESVNAENRMGNPGVTGTYPDYGLNFADDYILLHHFYIDGAYTLAQVTQAINDMWGNCYYKWMLTPGQGSGAWNTDYQTLPYRWSACNGAITYSSAGPDADWAMNQISSMTGISFTKVASGGEIQFVWTSGTGGVTSWMANGQGYLTSAVAHIGQNQDPTGIAISILHEAGHTVGLTHPMHTQPPDLWPNETPSSVQIMHWIYSSNSFTTYGAGDMGGMIAIGINRGC